MLSGSQSVCGAAARGSKAGRGGNLEKDVSVPEIFVEDVYKRNPFGRVGLGFNFSSEEPLCAQRASGFPCDRGT